MLLLDFTYIPRNLARNPLELALGAHSEERSQPRSIEGTKAPEISYVKVDVFPSFHAFYAKVEPSSERNKKNETLN